MADISIEPEQQLIEYFYSAKTGLRNLNDLLEFAKSKNIDSKFASEWYKRQEVVQRVSIPPRTHQYKILAGGPSEFQADLTFYTQYQRQNKNVTGILNLIEITTRYVYARPIKTKESAECAAALQDILDTGVKIKKISVDEGNEFKGKFAELCRKNKINLYVFNSSRSKNALSLVERFNRTLRMMIDKYMIANNTTVYVDKLQDFIHNYNHRRHSTLKAKPADFVTIDSRGAITENQRAKDLRFKNSLDNHDMYALAETLKIGDKVRKLEKPDKMTKELTHYSEEIYTVVGVRGNHFILKDERGREISPYYFYELKKIEGVESAPEVATVSAETPQQVRKARKLELLNKRTFSKRDFPEIAGHTEKGEPIMKPRMQPALAKRAPKPNTRITGRGQD